MNVSYDVEQRIRAENVQMPAVQNDFVNLDVKIAVFILAHLHLNRNDDNLTTFRTVHRGLHEE